MNSECFRWTEALRINARRLGASAVGITGAGPVDQEADGRLKQWLETGMNASMGYMTNHSDLRHDPRLLLEGAETIVAVTFNYYNPLPRSSGREAMARFSRYALGDDYHDVVRCRLETLARWMRVTAGGKTRVTVDTAPIHERYWARKAGIGVIGRNTMLIVNDAGSYHFIGLILWTGSVPADMLDRSAPGTCLQCGRCERACPAGAITALGVDARKCHSYLTIESRDEVLPEGTNLPDGRIYGCDICQEVCPHNADSRPTEIAEFQPREFFGNLTLTEVAEMDQPTFSTHFRRSAIKRAKLAGLRRNASHILNQNKK